MQKRIVAICVCAVLCVAAVFGVVAGIGIITSNAATFSHDEQKVYEFLIQEDESGVSNADKMSVYIPGFNIEVSSTWVRLSGGTTRGFTFVGGNLSAVRWSYYGIGGDPLVLPLHGSLDLSDCTSLMHISFQNILLTGLNVSGCTALESITCENCQLTELDVSTLASLTYLSCNDNQISALVGVSGLTALENLRCSGNQISELDVTLLTSLVELDCSNNLISTLNVSNLTSLTSLGCADNQIALLDVSELTLLDSIYCSGNKIFVLEVSALDKLNYLYCANNNITGLDLTSVNNPSLEMVQVFGNDLDDETLEKIMDLNIYTLTYSDKDGIINCVANLKVGDDDYNLAVKVVAVGTVHEIQAQIWPGALGIGIYGVYDVGGGVTSWMELVGLDDTGAWFDIGGHGMASYNNERIWCWFEMNTTGEMEMSMTVVLGPMDYNISYNGENAAEAENICTYRYGDTIVLQDPPAREGYEFDGWYDAETGGNKVEQIGPHDFGPKELWARWTQISDSNPFPWDYVLIGGAAVSLLLLLILLLVLFTQRDRRRIKVYH